MGWRLEALLSEAPGVRALLAKVQHTWLGSPPSRGPGIHSSAQASPAVPRAYWKPPAQTKAGPGWTPAVSLAVGGCSERRPAPRVRRERGRAGAAAGGVGVPAYIMLT